MKIQPNYHNFELLQILPKHQSITLNNLCEKFQRMARIYQSLLEHEFLIDCIKNKLHSH